MLSAKHKKKSSISSPPEDQETDERKIEDVDFSTKEIGFITRRNKASRSPHRGFQFSFFDPIIGGMDPFNNFNIPYDEHTARALNHWVYGFQETRAPMNPRQLWLQNSISDPTLLASTIVCSQAHIMFLKGVTKPTPTFISQKLKAIQAINRELSSSQSEISDYTIVSVAALALLECLAGTPAACAIHRRGLELLVNTRGGLENLGLEHMTERIVSWADTCCSIVVRSRPRFSPQRNADDEDWFLSREHETSLQSNLKMRLLQFTRSSALTECISRIWLRLRLLSEFIESIPANDTSTLDDSLFSDKLDSLEREILHVIHSSTLAKCPRVAFITAFLNAALIYIYQELREIPKLSAVGTALTGRIHSGLQMLDLTPVLGICPDILLWTMMLGKSASQLGGPNRAWFHGTLYQLTISLSIGMPEHIIGLWYFKIAELAVRVPLEG